MGINSELWHGKRILVTGHTGFKGAWLVYILRTLGAQVIGLALPPPKPMQSLYSIANVHKHLVSEYFIDIRDEIEVSKVLQESLPDYVFHLAAQSFVRRSFIDPIESFSTNVTGTANIVTSSLSIKSLLGITVATTDKVYRNDGRNLPFKETDMLGNLDPYSASKTAAELVVASLYSSCNPFKIPITTVRAGNVIGGGDWGEDRLVPDIVGALTSDREIIIRNPTAIRPWQHVLDCLHGYLLIAQSHLTNQFNVPRSVNFGPSYSLSVMELIHIFEDVFKKQVKFQVKRASIIESNWLELDSKLAHDFLGWNTSLVPIKAVEQTAFWYLKYGQGVSAETLITEEISGYFGKL